MTVTDVVDRSGILSSSPLVLALASVRFAPWPVFRKEIDQVQDALRDVTPLINPVHFQVALPGTPSIPPGSDVPPSAWLLLSEDKTRGIQIGPDQMLFHATAYTRYSEFEQLLRRGLQALLGGMKYAHITSVGVRYIDYIKPRPGERPGQYVSEKLLTPRLGGLEPVGGYAGYSYRKSTDTELRVASVCHPQALAIPNDLIPIIAMINHLAPGQSKLQLQALQPNEMLLDFDATKTNAVAEKIESAEVLLPQLSALHSLANEFFRHQEVCTDFAFKVWQEERKA